jgi:hypothetical protein
MNLVSDRVLAAAFLGELRLLPSLSHSVFDDVPLNPSALRASECSQVAARAACRNRRQFH